MTITENYHTHTFRCKHARGDVDDYIAAAREKGILKLGFADHTPVPDRWMHMIRMEIEDLPGYAEALERGKENTRGVRVYGGMECDYFAEYEGFYRDELLGRYKLDYLIGSVHAFPWQGERFWMHPGADMDAGKLTAYAEHVVSAMESGLFALMAHPDLFSISLHKWCPEVRRATRHILEAARSLNMPLEINVSGYEKARQNPDRFMPNVCPMQQFWEEASDFGVEVVVSSDAHAPDVLDADMAVGYRIAARYGLRLAALSL